MTKQSIAERLRHQCATLRTKPTPLADLIPLLQEAADALSAQQAAQPVAGEPVAFDAEGFRAWVAKNLPDDTIISKSAWWADHLTAWAQRFAAPVEKAPKCHCGDRAASECPGEWEPGCDLGANEAHVRVVPESAGFALKAALLSPVEKAAPAPMTAHRAAWFLERFKREEKLLGPNEQRALMFAIEALEGMAAQQAAHPEAVEKAAPSAVEQLAELMRGLEIPPTAAAMEPGQLFLIGQAIAKQAKEAQQAAQPVAGEPVWVRPDDLAKACVAPQLCRVEPAQRMDFVPLYTAAPSPVVLTDEQKDSVLADAIEVLQRQHDWLTRTAAVNLVAGTYGRAGAVFSAHGIKAGKDGAA